MAISRDFTLHSPLLQLSDWLCRGLSPFIARNKRLGRNFDERLVTSKGWAGEIQNCRKRIWIQAASLGEAQLASQLAFELGGKSTAGSFPELSGTTPGDESPKEDIGLLLTSGTPEGRAELLKTQRDLSHCAVRLFPLFTQTYMRRALQAAKPDMVVLLETELWPGLMLACAEAKIPLLILNARMSERSFKRYKLIKGLWQDFADKNVPAHISAISKADAERYAYFFGSDRVSLMPNIKFDRAAAAPSPEKIATLRNILPSPESAPTLLLASVRTEEEEQLAELIKKLRVAIPGLLTLIVPKHLERSASWLERLGGSPPAPPGLNAQDGAATSDMDSNNPRSVRLRSKLEQQHPARPGDTIVWDSMGELSALYGFAQSAFVGGSLAPLGGQNFLEALSRGVAPHIGPHWKNFAWVGRELIEQGLVKEVDNAQALETSLLRDLRETKDRVSIKKIFSDWLAQHQGGTKQAANLIRDLLAECKIDH